MLCQLVCLDRRYQRMNCFNIREIQTLLKTRFYADLLSESHQHIFLNRSTPTLRFKTQDLNFLNSCQVILHKYGVLTTPSVRQQTFMSTYDTLQSPILAPSFTSYSGQFSAMNTFYYTTIQGLTTSLPTATDLTIYLNTFNSLESVWVKLTGLQKIFTSTFWSTLLTNLVSTFTNLVLYINHLYQTCFLNFSNLQSINEVNSKGMSTYLTHLATPRVNATTLTFLISSTGQGLKLFTTNLLVLSPFSLMSNLSFSSYASTVVNFNY